MTGPQSDHRVAGMERLPRAAADETAADAARARYRTDTMPTLPADEFIAPVLEHGERVVAIHPSALLDRRQPALNPHADGVAGALYVTSRRLVLAGRPTLSLDLGEVEEAVLSGQRVLLVLSNGEGVTLAVEKPRLLRAEIAAARAGRAKVSSVGR